MRTRSIPLYSDYRLLVLLTLSSIFRLIVLAHLQTYQWWKIAVVHTMVTLALVGSGFSSRFRRHRSLPGGLNHPLRVAAPCAALEIGLLFCFWFRPTLALVFFLLRDRMFFRNRLYEMGYSSFSVTLLLLLYSWKKKIASAGRKEWYSSMRARAPHSPCSSFLFCFCFCCLAKIVGWFFVLLTLSYQLLVLIWVQ